MREEAVFVKNREKNIIYVGNLPKQLSENQIKHYFSQFGKIAKIRLMKSKKTNGSKGYAFVKFANHEVAKIAADAMNNYFIDGRALKVHVKDEDEIVKNLFNKGKGVLSRRDRIKHLSETMDLYNKALEEKMRNVIECLKTNENLTMDDDMKLLISRITMSLEKLESKKSKYGTDLYDQTILDYRNALDKLNKLVKT